jgi:RimJ/RimL family protein N-acetyltransferase
MALIEKYKVLDKQEFIDGEFKLNPLRASDRSAIRKWRNEQIYHLRQQRLITEADQDYYFDNVIASLFEMEKPPQILFSYLHNDECIGYGGLVHINWIDKNAEVSFIMNTDLEKDFFAFHWNTFLKLLEKIAFEELCLHKIFTWAFDIRQHLYPVLLSAGFREEARLREHCKIKGVYMDILIHSKFNNVLNLECITESDLQTTYQWAIDKKVRQFAFSKDEISLENHSKWFFQKLNNPDCVYLLLKKESQSIGSIRFDINQGIAIISYLVDPRFHGFGYGTKLLWLGEEYVKENRKDVIALKGVVMNENILSLKLFEKLGYIGTIEDSLHAVDFTKKLL